MKIFNHSNKTKLTNIKDKKPFINKTEESEQKKYIRPFLKSICKIYGILGYNLNESNKKISSEIVLMITNDIIPNIVKQQTLDNFLFYRYRINNQTIKESFLNNYKIIYLKYNHNNSFNMLGWHQVLDLTFEEEPQIVKVKQITFRRKFEFHSIFIALIEPNFLINEEELVTYIFTTEKINVISIVN